MFSEKALSAAVKRVLSPRCYYPAAPVASVQNGPQQEDVPSGSGSLH